MSENFSFKTKLKELSAKVQNLDLDYLIMAEEFFRDGTLDSSVKKQYFIDDFKSLEERMNFLKAKQTLNKEIQI